MIPSFHTWLEQMGQPPAGGLAAGPDDTAVKKIQQDISTQIMKQPSGDATQIAMQAAQKGKILDPKKVGELTAFAQGLQGTNTKMMMKSKMKKK